MDHNVVMLLGKPPREGTVPAQVVAALRETGHRVQVRLPHEEDLGPSDLAGADLVVHRGLSRRLDTLLAGLADDGVPLCNPWAGASLLRDRLSVWRRLRAAGIPVPELAARPTWQEVRDGARGRIVVKAVAGPGRGASVLRGTADTLPVEPPFAGPYTVEPLLPSDGSDRKLYVAGETVRGLLKASPLAAGHVTSGRALDPDTSLTTLALEVGTALEVHLYGVDALMTPDGPVVVDVNEFPGYRGVDGAAEIVAAHLRQPHA